jgi:hypothetical protein
MKLRLLAVLCAVLAFAFAPASNNYRNLGHWQAPTTISAANTAGASATPTTGSYVSAYVIGSGTQTVRVTLPVATWSGTLQCAMTQGNSTRVTLPPWQVVCAGIGFPTAIPSGGSGTWTVTVQGPGTFYVIASAWSSGSVSPIIGYGAGAGPQASWGSYFANAVTGLTVVSSRPCQLGGVSLINTDAAPVFLVGFDAATTGAVTLGTTAPAFVIPYPQSNGTAANGTADRFALPAGLTFQNGLVIAAVTTATGSTTSTNGLTGSILWH